jgi:serine/threonine-protein kinase
MVGPLAGRYVIRRELGNGAYAQVFLADDTKLGRAVAVKVLSEASTESPEAVQRLEREGRLSAAINHPNVCAVSDVGRLDDGHPFIVMEYLAGETLADRIEREVKLPVPVAIEFAEQMLLGLHAAHRLGIVHRDLKPANVFLVDLGLGRHLLKLLDFGTAYSTGSLEDAQNTLTVAGLVVGTPEYMSPEQLRGLRDFDARTDVYACGVVLYEMLSGRRPFGGLPLEQLCQAIAFKQAPPLGEIAPTVPAPVARAVDVALAVNPSRRHADAAAFFAALRRGAVPAALATGVIGVLPRTSRPMAAVDDWDLPTAQGGATVPSPAPVAAGADWELTTHQSGPPSVLGVGPHSSPAVRNLPPPNSFDVDIEHAGTGSIDVDLDETMIPTGPRRA